MNEQPNIPYEIKYNAFISYSHAADNKLAPALQSGLQRFTKPWYKLRALRIFRDQTNLAATPELWTTIERSLTESQYFILMASHTAAESKWVQKEIETWMALRRSKKLLIVWTEGTIQWSDEDGDFDWNQTNALPVGLRGLFTHEPLFVDLRWAREETSLSLRNPRFQEVIARLASPIHNKDLDILVGEEIRQYHRTRRTAWSAGIALLLLTILAITAAYLANTNATRAKQRLAALFEEQGRQEYLSGNRMRSSVYLNEAYQIGGPRTSLMYLLGLSSSIFKEFIPLQGHTDSLNDADFSSDGKLIITSNSG
jgi:hypothetical protein